MGNTTVLVGVTAATRGEACRRCPFVSDTPKIRTRDQGMIFLSYPREYPRRKRTRGLGTQERNWDNVLDPQALISAVTLEHADVAVQCPPWSQIVLHECLTTLLFLVDVSPTLH